MGTKDKPNYMDNAGHLKDVRERVESLKGKGYVFLPPPEVTDIQVGKTSEDVMSQGCLGGNPMQRTMGFFDDVQSHPVPVEHTGTDELGYIPWGPDNNLPNMIYSLAAALPYTAAAVRYVSDLATGLGPVFMYRYVSYQNGEVKENLIPYEDAGVFLLGRMRELRSQMATEQPEGRGEGTTIAWELAVNPAAGQDKPELGSVEYEIDQLKKDYEKWEQTLAEVQAFIENNNIALHYQKCMIEDTHLDMYFPTVGLSQGRAGEEWNPKIVRIGVLPAVCTRMEEMDDRLRINYVYYAEKWRRDATAKLEAKEIVSYPTLMPENRLNKLRKVVQDNRNTRLRRRPLWFCAPCYYPSMQKPYYPQPAWWSIFSSKVYDYASTLITDKATARENSTMWGKMIFIHNDYLRTMFDEQNADTEEEKQAVRMSIYAKINNFLKQRENNGKTICLDMFQGIDGKTMQHAVEIVDVPISTNSKELKDELEEICSIIFFAIGINPSVVGAVPGKSGSTGGTYQRELTLLKEKQLSPRQRTYLKFLMDVCSFNAWDKHGLWVIRQQVLTTLDRNKNGIEETESY